MASGGTLERRRRQGERIRIWKPWERSTGPKSQAGKERVSQNAWRGGTRMVLRALARVLRSQSELL
jgi:hypothetical protein